MAREVRQRFAGRDLRRLRSVQVADDPLRGAQGLLSDRSQTAPFTEVHHTVSDVPMWPCRCRKDGVCDQASAAETC